MLKIIKEILIIHMHFFWVDCEMTGLDIEKDLIIELAFILTDQEMNKINCGEYIVHHSQSILCSMNEWCREHHTKSGLFNKSLESKTTYEEIEEKIMLILINHTKEKEVYFAGNSVYIDALFIRKFFPLIYNWMHYRLFDISTFKIRQELLSKPTFKKLKTHRALKDIEESIQEYFFYQSN